MSEPSRHQRDLALRALGHYQGYLQFIGTKDHVNHSVGFVGQRNHGVESADNLTKDVKRQLTAEGRELVAQERTLWHEARVVALDHDVCSFVRTAATSMPADAPLLPEMVPLESGVVLLPDLGGLYNQLPPRYGDPVPANDGSDVLCIAWRRPGGDPYASGVEMWVYVALRDRDGVLHLNGLILADRMIWDYGTSWDVLEVSPMWRRNVKYLLDEPPPALEFKLMSEDQKNRFILFTVEPRIDCITLDDFLLDADWWASELGVSAEEITSRVEEVRAHRERYENISPDTPEGYEDILQEFASEVVHYVKSFMLTLWAFMSDRIVMSTEVGLPRAARRRMERSGLAPDAGSLRLIHFRAHDYAHEKNNDPEPVEWSHRWLVRGHWRRLRTGRVTWVRPHVKGPSDKPFVPRADVYMVDE